MQRILRKLTVLAGDLVCLYLALFLLMFVRYGENWQPNWEVHLRPFSLTFVLWILTIYGTYLYETRYIRFGVNTLRAIGTAVAISTIASVTAFYIFPPGLIYPRRNMVLFAIIFGALMTLWRLLFYKTAGRRIKTNLLFVGGGTAAKELKEYFNQHKHLGYESKGELETIPDDIETFNHRIKSEGIKLIVVNGRRSDEPTKHLFSLLASGVSVIELEEFYEDILGKVSLDTFSDLWFINNLENINAEVYRIVKRSTDIAIGILGSIVFVVLYIPAGLIIKIDSRGPVIFKQRRVGKDNKAFTMYKFRTMRVLNSDGSAETGGAEWTQENDKRITRVGKLFRNTRIDELPQFVNILLGDMSFVGPRPERPEFVDKLVKEIPYYNMRHLVRPGLTGWAQINFEYGDSVDDARTKLQYEIYYAKKRSMALDVAIILKTARIVLSRQGQ